MTASPSLDTASDTDLDTRKKYVRVLEQRADGLVLFEFAIGWPELLVELLLPEPAFAEFCATHRVIRLDH
ncbi:phenol hydroxylase [Sphaerotilus montanus]|jgi:phenol hydroxylase P0 protein|uniref:Phenol hydroxylase P0 protein n=1 Tax=Sphaerotilus montanus TaxID=522889 RepID=A0A7Y9QZM7_9BURK|nr:phenol hydroxylase subunit [Sphaerotilus montanus]NYG32510.1 phenol hydroxylase P0 protein [Sphaerotilus montanus]NZD56297.1 phenol hydroxylase [Sphaerotilus montanus]